MSELPEKTIEVRFGVGVVSEMPLEGIWLKVETEIGTEGFVSLANLVALLNPPKAEKGPRLFPGTPPTWEQLCGSPTFVDVDGARWLVSARDDYKTAPKWRDIKVFAAEPAQNKGNYFLSWNVKGAVFAAGREFDLLKGHRPELLAAVSARLSKVNWPK
jgi:hypothetical protein